MALSFLTGFSPLQPPRRPDAAPEQGNQPAATAPERGERLTDRRNAPAVQVRLSPEALAVLNGAPPPNAAQPAAPAQPNAPARTAAFEPLAFRSSDAPAAEGPAASGAQPPADAPERPRRPGSRLDIKL